MSTSQNFRRNGRAPQKWWEGSLGVEVGSAGVSQERSKALRAWVAQGVRRQGSQLRQRVMGSQVPVNNCGRVFGDGTIERGDKPGRWEEVSRQNVHWV